MYYGFYLLAIALAVMIGQLAFALYQVANLLYLSWAGTAGISPCPATQPWSRAPEGRGAATIV